VGGVEDALEPVAPGLVLGQVRDHAVASAVRQPGWEVDQLAAHGGGAGGAVAPGGEGGGGA